MIHFRQVYKWFGPLHVLKDVALQISQGEVVVVCGPSGSGKSTLIRCINKLEPIQSGEIIVDGIHLNDPGLDLARLRAEVGMVFQQLNLYPHMTALENIVLAPVKVKGLSRAEGEKVAMKLLERVGIPEKANAYPANLSGGQQQRVALARALAPSPQVVLLDEPFSNLDADMRAQMRQDVHTILHQAGTTSIFVTHDQEEAFMIADRVGVLNQGRLEQIDKPDVIYHTPATRFVARFVGSADFIPGVVQPAGILTELGTFPNQQGLPLALAVEVMIRPDDIELTADLAGEATVVTRHFRGSDNLYCVRLPSGRTVHSSQGSTKIVEPGARILVKADPTHVVCFDADDTGQ